MSTEPTSRHEKSSQSNDSEEVLLEDYLEKSEVTTTNNTSNGQSGRANITTNNNTNNDEENIISINEILHCTSSFKVIVTPITLTMILSALSVTFLTTNVAVTYAPYNIEGEENASSSDVRKLGLSLVNSLIIICAIIVMTFIVVLLYKYRFMKCLIGYMILSSAALLALLGGSMFETFLQITSIPFDTLSFYFFLYNFAIVGTVSIFYQKGIPPLITKAYLVATSTIVAWRLSSLDPWTAWTLLVLLALYDLCAVLTCCGPLKLLVNMMSKDGAPSMPGLLYEGTLPDGVHRNRRDSNSNNNTGADNGESGNDDGDGNHRTTENGNSTQTTNGHHSNRNTNNNERSRSDISRKRSKIKRTNGSSRRNESENNTTDNHGRSNTDQDQSIQRETSSYNSSNNHSYHQNGNQSRESQPRSYTDRIVQEIPLALARLYRLEIIAPQQYATPAGSRYSRQQEGEERRSPIQQQEYSAEELRSNVQVLFQGGGGRIEVETSEGEENGIEASRRRRRRRNRPSTQDEVRYIIIDRHGVVKRKLFVNMEGKIFEEIEKEVSAEPDDGDNTIKLGLGDFIFYSVLVSKAAQYSFTTFATCTIAIITGFGGTCILLSLYHKALPALPVSIFLGVIFYLATRFIIQDWIELIMTIPIYV